MLEITMKTSSVSLMRKAWSFLFSVMSPFSFFFWQLCVCCPGCSGTPQARRPSPPTLPAKNCNYRHMHSAWATDLLQHARWGCRVIWGPFPPKHQHVYNEVTTVNHLPLTNDYFIHLTFPEPKNSILSTQTVSGSANTRWQMNKKVKNTRHICFDNHNEGLAKIMKTCRVTHLFIKSNFKMLIFI